MVNKLYKHQQRFIDKNPNQALLVWETGTGKTIAACEWLQKRHMGFKCLIVCPKNIKEKWKRDVGKPYYIQADVVTQDEIKKIDLTDYDCIVVDEAHNFSSPLFTKQRSHRSTLLYNHIKKTPDINVLLLTATPIRSTPWNIHTLACYIGTYWNVKDFRNSFFYLTDMYGTYHYEKKEGWQTMIRPYLESIADIVLMSDCIDVPTQHEEVITVVTPKIEGAWHERHRNEQGIVKLKKLKTILDGYRKAIVVCHYTSQIDEYFKSIGSDRLVYVLDGRTKYPDTMITQARRADDCIFIIQASMGAGFDAGEFSVMVFASLSFRYIDMVQMKGRIKRINNLHENKFIYLLGGVCDKNVYETIQSGRDFDPHDYKTREDEQPF